MHAPGAAEPYPAPRFVDPERRARLANGPCRVGAPLDGDGVSSARVRLLCERGTVDATVEVDPSTGRLSLASFASPPEATCVP